MVRINLSSLWKNKVILTIASLIIVAVFVFLDVVSGSDFSFSFFYLIPIFLVAWYGDLPLALFVAIVAVLVRSGFDIHWHDDKRPLAVLIWKVVSRALVQGAFAVLIWRLKATLVKAQNARREAEEATRAKSRFLATMSHDIRTPMNSILGMAELLDRSPLDARQKGWVKIFRREGALLMNLLNDLLDFSKIEARQYQLEPTTFELAGVLEEVQSLLGVQAREHLLELRIETDPLVPSRIHLDRQALRRILFNLVGNAIKFTDHGSITVGVRRAGDTGDELRFSVSDTGVGIPEDQRQRIFTPFAQAHSAVDRDVGGTGLGLSIVRDLLELMGGRITVESWPGVGSRFDFFLPLVPGQEDEPSPASPPPAVTGGGEPVPLSLLVADDYATNRLIVKEYLRDLPYRITEVENGQEAVDAVKNQAFSLVLMDVKMPVLDGYCALEQIREWERQAGRAPVPIVALTAQTFPEDVRKALAAGFQAHLGKPLERSQVLAVIRQWGQTDPNPGPPPGLEQWTARYLDEVRQFRQDSVAALAASNLDRLESIGHRLLGSGSVFGYPELSQIGMALEASAQRGDRAGMQAAIDSLSAFVDTQEVR